MSINKSTVFVGDLVKVKYTGPQSTWISDGFVPVELVDWNDVRANGVSIVDPDVEILDHKPSLKTFEDEVTRTRSALEAAKVAYETARDALASAKGDVFKVNDRVKITSSRSMYQGYMGTVAYIPLSAGSMIQVELDHNAGSYLYHTDDVEIVK